MPSNEVLEQRVTATESRLKTLEGVDREDRTRESERYALLIERIAIMETRVGNVAAKAGAATGLISSICTAAVILVIKSAVGG